jgi:hypothetical protein
MLPLAIMYRPFAAVFLVRGHERSLGYHPLARSKGGRGG